MIHRKVLARFVVVATLLVTLGIAGCSSAPKPKELKELERILGEEGANEVGDVPGAGQYYQASRKLRREALNAWEDNHIEKARQYAIRGKIKYRTAEAIAKQLEAKKRMKRANAKVKKINPKVQKLAEQRKKLRNEVQTLRRKVQTARQAKERAQAQKASEDQAKSGAQKQRKAAQNQLERARKAKEEAQEVQADKFAKAPFNRASNELQSAASFLESGSYSQAARTAKSAKSLFAKAKRQAEPKYREQQKKKHPEKRLASLKEKLVYNFGEEQVESVGKGVRVVIPELFARGAENIERGRREALKTTAKLAKKFDEFDIIVDGYTRKGDATENLSISQVRARKVEKFLKKEGISGNRIESDGHGQGNIRYPDTPSKNDRIEITYRIGG